MPGKLWSRAELVGRWWAMDTEFTNKGVLEKISGIASREPGIRESVKQAWKKVGTLVT